MPRAVLTNRHSRRRVALLFGVLLSALFVTSVLAIIADERADRELGQIDTAHNTPNFGGPSALAGGVGGVAIDSSSVVHHVYVADTGNARVLGWNDASKLASGAPADLVIGQPDFFSSSCNDGVSPSDANGLGADSLCIPMSVAVDGSGNLYVADNGDNRVLEYDTPFAACAGSFPCVGPAANLVFGQGGDFTAHACAVTQTGLCGPGGVAVDSNGNLFIADSANSRVLEYNGHFGSGQPNDVTADLVFGQGGNFTTNTCSDGKGNHPVPSATGLCHPGGVAVNPSGNVFIADSTNSRVLEYNGLFGSGQANDVTADLVFGQGGDLTAHACGGFPGAASATDLCRPNTVAVDASGNVYIADGTNNRVLEYDGPFGSSQTNDVTADRVYGQGGSFTANTCFNGLAPNPAPSATGMCNPTALGLDSGNLYVLEMGNARVNVFDNALGNSTANLALGQTDLAHNMPNFGGAAAETLPANVAVDRNSTPNHLYISDNGNNRVLGYHDATTFLSGGPADIVLGQPDFFTNLQNGLLNTPSATTLASPVGLAVDQQHNLAVADLGNNRVLVFPDPFSYSGSTPEPATIVIGQGASATTFNTKVCGNGVSGNPAPSATNLCTPSAVAFDASGNLFVADFSNSRVLEYNAALTPNATANLVFGQGAAGTGFTTGSCGDGMGLDPVPSATSLCRPNGVALDANGDLFVADGVSRVLEYNGPFGSGHADDVTADLVFGRSTGTSFGFGLCADGLGQDPAPSATGVCVPAGITVSSAGDLYVADQQNNRVLKFVGPFGSGMANDVTADVVFGQGSGGTNFASNACAGGAFSALGTAAAVPGAQHIRTWKPVFVWASIRSFSRLDSTNPMDNLPAAWQRAIMATAFGVQNLLFQS